MVVHSRKTDDDEVQPVPGVPEVGELGEGEPAPHHLGRRLEGVDCCEDYPGECTTASKYGCTFMCTCTLDKK